MTIEASRWALHPGIEMESDCGFRSRSYDAGGTHSTVATTCAHGPM